jgi:D-proline reductase (dithiol) PrdB
MDPIQYVDRITEYYLSQLEDHPPYRWSVYDSAPLHRLSKPIAECTVAVLTSGGVSMCAMPAFNPDAINDHRLDEISADASANDFQIHDNYYHHIDAEEDINCIFPLERLRELAASGEIGAVAPRLWSGFMGKTYNRKKIREESGPAFADELQADKVDVLIAAPACPLDHQTVGLVCRVLEERGIATVYVGTAHDITAQVKPPRALFVNHPNGNNFGAPGDTATQLDILRTALSLLETAEEGGTQVDMPTNWPEPFGIWALEKM